MLRNPFITMGYQGPEYFCDRKKETEKLIMNIENGNNVVLMSPRRMGKTGLLLHTFNQERIKSYYNTFIIDIYSTGNLQEMVAAMGKEILSQLMPKGERAIAKFAAMVSSLRPKMSFDLMGMPSWSVDVGTITYPEFTLEQIFKYLEQSEKPNIIAIDEFQQIANYPEKNVEAILRTHIQKCSNTNWIFSGSSYHMLAEIFHTAARPFYKSTTSMGLEAINLDKYKKFASELFHSYGKEIDDSVTEEVYSRFDGVTWFVQKMMNRLFAYTDKGSTCTIDMVNQTLVDILDENSNIYVDLLYQLTQRQKELLLAIIKEGKATAITGGKFIKKHNLHSPSTVQASIATLIDKQIVTKRDNEYEVYDKFFGQWVLSRFA